MICNSQSLSVSIDESLEERFIVGDGLQDVAVSRHVANRPLAQPSAAQPEDVTVRDAYLNKRLQTLKKANRTKTKCIRHCGTRL